MSHLLFSIYTVYIFDLSITTNNNNMQTLTFKEKSVYGRTLIYAACDKSNIFAGLLGTKTFTLGQLGLIKSLGYEINLIPLS